MSAEVKQRVDALWRQLGIDEIPPVRL